MSSAISLGKRGRSLLAHLRGGDYTARNVSFQIWRVSRWRSSVYIPKSLEKFKVESSQLEMTKQGLLQHALTGKVRVTI